MKGGFTLNTSSTDAGGRRRRHDGGWSTVVAAAAAARGMKCRAGPLVWAAALRP